MRFLLFFIPIVIIASCRQPVDISTVSPNSCRDTLQVGGLDNNCSLQINYPLDNESFFFIQDQNELDSLVTIANCNLNIDFDNFDLVVGRIGLSSNMSSIAYEYICNCDIDEQILKVYITQGPLTIAPLITYSVLIPKLSEEEFLVVEYEISYN